MAKRAAGQGAASKTGGRRKAPPSPGKASRSDNALLAGIFRKRAPEGDLAGYDDATIDLAAALASAAVRGHRKGASVIAIDRDPALTRSGRPVSAITVVNDNMPFLFDSVLGEITESCGEPLLVLHPVLDVEHGRSGVTAILGDGGNAQDAGADKLSLIHVHVSPLPAEQAQALEQRLAVVLEQVRAAVIDWQPMLARLDHEISELRHAPAPLAKAELAEAVSFLEWLRDDNFTFLGMRELRYSGSEADGELKPVGQGLGILAYPDVRVLRRGNEAVNTTPEIRLFLHGPDALIVTKANARSLVHRRAYLDYIGVKTFDAKGKLTGELRIVGLFTSTAYTRSVFKIPYIRSKADQVIAGSGFSPTDHSGKALINVLESYPRDEFFQVPTALLRKHAMAILALGERPRVRVLYRVDQFERFVSVLVFVPRDRYDSRVRSLVGDYLKHVFDGRVSAFYPAFPEGGLARVHFIIGRSGGKTPTPSVAELEEAVRKIVRTWDDGLREAVGASDASAQVAAMAAAMPESYRDSFAPDVALVDAARLLTLAETYRLAVDFHRHQGQSERQAALKIYSLGQPVALSQRVPLLENMGFRVISEQTFDLGEKDGTPVFIHDMEIESAYDRPINLADEGVMFEDIFLAVWNNEVDDDRYNALGHTAGMRAVEIVILRAYGRYLQQAGIPQSQGFIAGALNRYPAIAIDLFQLFVSRFDPAISARDRTAATLTKRIEATLEEVPNIDDDTIIRRYLNLIASTLRTNHYALADGRRSLALKLDSRAVTGLPEPRPWREIFVYGPEVEGVHLRFGPIARGGLRWSDRAQDYRTEVLGLVKAQQVKNAVIVPVGAKGGFFPKRLPASGREAIFEAGRAAYVNFIASLLSVTDNLVDGEVVPPSDVVRHDGDDPYFVVAADKGTASFSDTANAISQAHDFWLDDAFASGGSAGYDHKKMGITARGAWEAVKRHFREMDRDIQTEPFTVVGVGDMSGDVFGNGMLLSPEIRLVAAFDHRDIFIDPAPDAAASLAERQRLFDLPRSSWQDYDRTKLSKGGVIVSRTQKSIALSPEAAQAIGLGKTTASPNEIMSAILKAPVDLLWFGGIGTYLRASGQSNADVGDRANDAIRVTASEVRAKVIGEGANLGMTQRARIEYGLAGGRCNSDAIDNSAGVNSSDIEVNIKIALAAAMRSGSLARAARNRLLAQMTDQVAALVLANNYRQPLAISLARQRGLVDLPHQARMMASLEAAGRLDRAVEDLPSPDALAEREKRGEPLTRPEIGVLLAYAKLTLFDDIVGSDLPDDPHFDADLIGYFPARMVRKYRSEIETHRLRREIIATDLANDCIDRGGPSFISRMQDMTGCAAAEAVAAYATVRDGFDLPEIFRQIDALDNRVAGDVQLGFYQQVVRLVHVGSAWFLKHGEEGVSAGQRIGDLRATRKAIEGDLATLMPGEMQAHFEAHVASLEAAGAPQSLARRLALAGVSEFVPDIALVARHSGADLGKAASIFFALTEAFRIGRIEEAAHALPVSDYYEGLAVTRALDMIGMARRGMAQRIVAQAGRRGDPVAAWLESGGERVRRVRERLQALTEGELSVARLTVAAGLMHDLIQA
jgi:glutamate dehydrogenase